MIRRNFVAVSSADSVGSATDGLTATPVTAARTSPTETGPTTNVDTTVGTRSR